MTLGKNFRLPTDVKPKAYDADLRLDLNADRFEGELAIEVRAGRRAARDHRARGRPGGDGGRRAEVRRAHDRGDRRRPTPRARP